MIEPAWLRAAPFHATPRGTEMSGTRTLGDAAPD